MMNENDGFEPDGQDAGGDPAEAFDTLRRSIEKLARDVGVEMTAIRKGKEAAFEEFEKFQQPSDYGPELGRIVKQLTSMNQEGQMSASLSRGPSGSGCRCTVAGDIGERIKTVPTRRLSGWKRGSARGLSSKFNLTRAYDLVLSCGKAVDTV